MGAKKVNTKKRVSANTIKKHIDDYSLTKAFEWEGISIYTKKVEKFVCNVLNLGDQNKYTLVSQSYVVMFSIDSKDALESICIYKKSFFGGYVCEYSIKK